MNKKRFISILVSPFIGSCLFATQSYPSEKTQEPLVYILSALDSHDVIILGETHQHNESEDLVYKIVKNRVKSGKPLSVALEIDSDQNYLIKNCDVDEIKLPHVKEFTGYRSSLKLSVALK